MGIMSTARFLQGRGTNMLLAAKLIPEVTRLVKKRGKDQVAAALSSDEDMTVFATGLYEELSPSIRAQVPLDGFIGIVLQNRTRLMGLKKNQKKVEKKVA